MKRVMPALFKKKMNVDGELLKPKNINYRNMKKLILLVNISLLLFTACIEEDHFGLSPSANILEIQVENQNGNSKIDRDTYTIEIQLANGVDLSAIELTRLSLSSYAHSSVNVGETINFESKEAKLSITAEDKTQKEWTIYVEKLGSEPQLDNSDFNFWYEHSAGYMELGEHAESTLWGTSNPGVVFGGMEANVLQEDLGDASFAIRMETRYSRLAALVKKPIAAASAFTGVFNVDEIDINDPEAAIEFGTPFTATPNSFSIDYTYVPGSDNIDMNGNELAYSDSCDIYAVLERREGDVTSRLATAWFRTDGEGEGFKTITLDFIYGELPAGSPSYMYPKDGQAFADPNAKPTHINIVFSSSANGAIFQGAENSVLLVNNLMLNYEILK